LARTKKQPSITSQTVHNIALQSIVKDFRDSIFAEEDSELLAGKHFRKQDKLAQKAVDEFHADLVGAIN
jgi:hypothetical protein